MTNPVASRSTPNNPFIGKTFGGKYTIESLIGRGGMGLVHRAREEGQERDVVIKMLAPHFAEDDMAVARFEREGRRLAQLFHPNIVELYDLGWDEDQSYIVMEYIDGEPLRHHLARKGRLTVAEFAPIADQILSAVAVAHEQQMMLRDIKPSNIMLCERDGKANFVKMLDFGLAKLVDGDDVEVTKAHVIGTAGYLAPEQIKGDDTDVRVDIYALGILFFVMLTGTSPILGENDGAILYNHVHGEPLRLEATLPPDSDVPQKLIDLIHRCMEKNPARRPEDARALAAELRAILPPESFELPEVTSEFRDAVEAFRKSSSRNTKELDDIEPSSSEWTRPHLRKLLDAGADRHKKRRSETSKPPPRRKKTMMGIAPVDSAPKPPPRRPPPAKTPASGKMGRTTDRRRTLSPLQTSGVRPPVRRPKPKALVKLEDAQIPEIEVEDIVEFHDAEEESPAPSKTLLGMPSLDGATTQPKHPAPTVAVTPVLSTAPAMPALTRTDPATPGMVAPSAEATESALPIMPAILGKTAPATDVPGTSAELEIDLDESLDHLPGAGTTLLVDRGQEPYFPEGAVEPERPVWIYVVSGVLLVVVVAMVVYVVADVLAEPETTSGPVVMMDSSWSETPAAKAEDPSSQDTPASAADAPREPTEPPSAVPQAELRVEAPEDAVVFIDDREVGSGPFEGAWAPGVVHVRVERAGHRTFETTVELAADRREVVSPDLVAEAPARPTLPRTAPSDPRPSTSKTSSEPKALPSKAEPVKKSPGADPFSEAPKADSRTPKSDPPPAPKTEPAKKDDKGDLFIDKGEPSKGGVFLPVGGK
jgi:serine/threonine protein kinase